MNLMAERSVELIEKIVERDKTKLSEESLADLGYVKLYVMHLEEKLRQYAAKETQEKQYQPIDEGDWRL